MKKIQTPAWQTSDGRLFFDEEEARDVELRLAFQAFAKENWSLGYAASEDEVAEWLIQNRRKLKELLNGKD